VFSELKKNLCSRRGILLAGCALTLLYAFFSHGYYHHDEHFQILEYACMKLSALRRPTTWRGSFR